MRICSLLPSATEIVFGLELGDRLVAVSEECDFPAEARQLPRVTASRVDTSTLDSRAIDDAVRAAVADGRSLYAIDGGAIERLAPDVILTQDLCEVCAVSSGDVAALCPVDARVVSLDPRTLAEVADSVRTLGRELGAAERARTMAATFEETISRIRTAVAGRRRPRVFVNEWLEPPYAAGHWVPEMVAAAGGEEIFDLVGQPSRPTTWDDVLEREPALVVLAACGYDAARIATEARSIGLPGLPCRVVAVDANAYLSRPGPRLADGVVQLAHLLHPEVVPDPCLPLVELGR
jgi:iron complex transport system substrate-binding protein